MRDASVPTPAIVDSRLIEAPFEVAIKASQSRRFEEAEPGSSSKPDENEASGGTSLSPAQLRERRRVAKEAEKEIARLEKIEAKRILAQEKDLARQAKRKVEKIELAQVTPEPDGPALAKEETKPAAPRARSSFDELMGNTPQ